MAELPELRRGAAEARGRRSSRPPAGPGGRARASSPGGRCAPRTRPGSRAAARRASWPRPCAAHVDEHAERPVAERPRLAAGRARRRRCRPRRRPWRIACWRWAGSGACRRLAGRARRRRRRSPRRCRGPPRASCASVSMRPPRVERQAELAHDRRRLHARPSSTAVRVGMRSPVESVTASRSAGVQHVPVRISIPRPRSSRVANSARLAGISGMIRSRASTRIQRVPSSRQRG